MSSPSRAARLAAFAPVALLAEEDFRRVWLSGAAVGTIRWIEMLATAVYVFQHTRSAFAVALLTLLRMLPMPLLGAFVGALGERYSRRSVLLLVLWGAVIASIVQGGLAWSGRLEVWHLHLGALINGLFWVVDLPLRRTMLGEIAGPGRTAAAMGLDTATSNATRLLGPGVGGLLLELIGIQGAFLLGTALYLLAIRQMHGLRVAESIDRSGGVRVIERIAEGLRIVREDRGIVGTFFVTIVFNVFAWSMTAMVPVIGEHQLGLSAFPIGLLMSADGLGALAGALWVSAAARPPRFRGIYLGGVALYLVASILFALSPWPAVSGLAQIIVGLGGAGFATMQSTIVFLSAPPAARPRVMGLLSVCIGSAVVGFLQVGLVADRFGAAAAILASAAAGLAALGFAGWWWPEIRPRAAFDNRMV